MFLTQMKTQFYWGQPINTASLKQEKFRPSQLTAISECGPAENNNKNMKKIIDSAEDSSPQLEHKVFLRLTLYTVRSL